MSYAEDARAYAGIAGNSASIAPLPADLHSLRLRLQEQVERASAAAYRINEAADQVFGPRPTDGAAGVGVESPRVIPVSELIEDLARALSRIEAGLDRL